MSESRNLMVQVGALLAIVCIMIFALSDRGETFHGYLDIKAALLVFLTPIFVSLVFQREKLSWREALRRIKEIRNQQSPLLSQELQKAIQGSNGNYSLSSIAQLSEGHTDSFLKYAGGLFASRFSPEEIGEILTQRIEAEDTHWQSISNFFGFLAKMAPYFGMLATVVGMVKLLQNMNDYTKISGGMALAMQGTLYGLISFTMVYSPLQRFFSGYRDLVYKRNEMITKWIVLLSQKADPHFIREGLKSMQFAEESVKSKSASAPIGILSQSTGAAT